MRVLQLISSRGYYGAENVVQQLAAALSMQGDRVSIAILDPSATTTHPLAVRARARGIRVLHLPCSGKVNLSVIRDLRHLLQSEQIEILHTHNYKSNMYGYCASRGLGIPIVATCHNWTDTTRALRVYGVLDRLLLRCFDRVVAVSDSTRARLSGGQALEEKLSIIGNGVEMPELSGAQASAANGHSSMVVGVAARLSREKGVEIFLRAAAEVAGIHPGTRFVIAGDGPERPHLETLAKELGLVSRVTFLGFCSNIGSFLSGLNIFVQPSLVDAMPMSVLEAMAHGLPVIAAAVGAIPEILGQRERGVLFPAGDVSSLAGRILDLSNDAGLRSHLGGEARGYAAEHCSAAAMAERYRSVYQQAREERSVAAALAAV